MTFLSPWWLLGLVLVPALLLWGLLAPRGRPVTVGSLVLWRRALSGGATGRPTARLRLEDPLLWLDACCVLLVILACARPAFHTERPLDAVATVVLDHTASMQMPSDGPEGRRWKDARRFYADVLEDVGNAPVREVHVPSISGVPLAVTLRPEAIRARGFYEDGVSPWAGDVYRVAAEEAVREPGRPVVVITDVAPTEPLPENVYVLATGGPSTNAGLVRVAGRLSWESREGWLLVEARASPDAPGPYALAMYKDVDATELVRRVEQFVSPGETARRVFGLEGERSTLVVHPPGEPEGVITGQRSPRWNAVRLVRLEGPDDGFPPDNTARTLPGRPPAAVRVIGTCPASLRRALEATGHVNVVEVASSEPAALEGADLLVACGEPLPEEWTGPAVVMAPREAVGPVRPTGETVESEWRVAEDHPLAEALYLPPPRLDRVPRYEVTPDVQILVGTREAPLIVTSTHDGAKRLAVLFDVGDPAVTDWPRRASFPVFWARVMRWFHLRPYGMEMFGAEAAVERMTDENDVPFEAKTVSVYSHSVILYREPAEVFGTDEGFQAGPGRDDSQAAAAAIEASIEARREAALADAWPWAVVLALAALAARAWVAR
jgi:hypothetical protein